MDKQKVIYREVAGESMLVPVGETAAKYNGVFVLTPTAAAVFKGYTAGISRDEIIAQLLEEFDADRNTVEADVDEFLKKLDELEIV